MLPRSARLRRTAEIQRVLREGKCITTPYLRICTIASITTQTRVACVVGKSVHRGAVRRHRYQRWLREVAKVFLREQAPSTPYDMVWIAQPGMVSVGSLQEFTTHVAPALRTLQTKLST